MIKFGRRLAEERKRLGLTQAELAERGGVSMRAQNTYENDHRTPDAAYLAAVAGCGVDVTYVLTGIRVTTESSLSPKEAALLDNFRHSAPEDREAIQQIGSAFAQRSRMGRDDGEEDGAKACGGSGK